MRGWGGGGVAGSQPASTYTGAQINFGDLTPYLTYGWKGPGTIYRPALNIDSRDASLIIFLTK
jgi:hypothetical protein